MICIIPGLPVRLVSHLLKDWASYSGYYNDYYGDMIVSVNAGWDFQTGNSGDGMVNTTGLFRMKNGVQKP